MLRAADVMSRDVIHVKEDTPIFEAIGLLAQNDISGLPVVKDDMTLAGVLSEKDVIVLFYECGKAEDKMVADYMTYPAVCFEEDEPLLDICDFLLKNIFRRVPITSKGKLVGIISVSDVLEAVLRMRERALAKERQPADVTTSQRIGNC